MNDFEPTLKQYRSDFIDAVARIAAKNRGVVDIGEWSNNLAFDVLPHYQINVKVSGAITFSQNFGALRGGEKHFYITALHKNMKLVGFVCPDGGFCAEIVYGYPVACKSAQEDAAS
jgi:hypothetical protein